MATTYNRISTVEKTFRILEYLAECREPVTASRIAGDLDISVHTVMCHLATHQDGGYVQMVGDHYKIGMKLAVFWARMKSLKEVELLGVEQDLRVLNGEA